MWRESASLYTILLDVMKQQKSHTVTGSLFSSDMILHMILKTGCTTVTGHFVSLFVFAVVVFAVFTAVQKARVLFWVAPCSPNQILTDFCSSKAKQRMEGL